MKSVDFEDILYIYKPKPNFIDSDSVTIEILVGVDGYNLPTNVSEIITLYFEIKE